MPDMNENAETQQEYFGKVRTDNTKTLYNALNKIKELEAQIEKMKCCENCAKNGHICVAEEMQGNLCGKNKDKWELRR